MRARDERERGREGGRERGRERGGEVMGVRRGEGVTVPC